VPDVTAVTEGRDAVRRLAAARLVSLMGTGAANVALLISMYEVTGSAAWVSATLVATHGVQVFFALFTAGLGDRLDRRRLMIGCEVAGSACFLAMVFTPAPGPLLAVALLSALAASPFHSASAAAIPNLVGREHLSWANSMVSAGRNLGMTLGPVVGGFVAATLSPGTVFAGNAVSFLLSALVIASVRGRFSGDRAATADHRGVHAGLVFLWRDQLLRTLLLAEAVLVLGLGLIQVARVPLVESFALGSVALGLLDAVWGGGLLVGSISGRRMKAEREPTTFVLGLAGVAAASAAIGVSPWFAPIVAFNFLIGLADSLDLIAGQGIRQRRTPDAVLGRVIAANSALCVLAQMAGYGASGLLVPVVGPQGIYLVCGGVVAVSAVFCLRAVRLAPRRPAPEPAPAEPPSLDEADSLPHLPVT
jgi:MFS family permease